MIFNYKIRSFSILMLAVFTCLFTAPCCLGEQNGFDLSVIDDFRLNPNLDNYDRLEKYMDKSQGGNSGTISKAIDQGLDIMRESENDWGGALKTALRNVDDTVAPDARTGSNLYRLGKGAEIFDLLSRSVLVYDEYNKGEGGHSYDASVLAGRELTKMLAGNYMGGLAITALAGTSAPILSALAVGYVASKGAEGFLQLMFDGYDKLQERSGNLSQTQRSTKINSYLQDAKEEFNIPDNATVTTYKDELGNTVTDTTWTDPDTDESYTCTHWYNKYGHEMGSDFARTEYAMAVSDASGGEYHESSKATLRDLIEGRDDDGQEDEDNDSRSREDSEILDYVNPLKASATAMVEGEISYGKEIATITTTFTLSFYNVGSLAKGYEKAILNVTEKKPNGSKSTMTWVGTFSGGPNGIFRLSCKEDEVVFRLKNGTATESIDGIVMKVTRPDVFKGWPVGF